MSAYIRNGNIYIKVPVKALSTGWKACIDTNRAHKGYEDFRIIDENAFAKDLVRTLNHEAENGDTMVTDLFDRAVEKAIADGADGVFKVEHVTSKRATSCYGAGADCKCPLKKE